MQGQEEHRSDILDIAVNAARQEDHSRIRELLLPLHPSDLADLFEQMDAQTREQILRALGESLDPVVLTELDEAVREQTISRLGVGQLAEALSRLETDDAVDLAEGLDDELRQEAIGAMPEPARRLLESSFAYPENSAGRLMQRETMAVPAHWTIGETVDHVRTTSDGPDSFHNVFVLDENRVPVGVLALDALLRAEPTQSAADVMERKIDVIPVTTDQEDVALLFRDHDLVSAPVVDEAGRLVGMITVDDVVDVIDEEAEEDLMRLAGLPEDDLYRAGLATARSRFSWLAVNLLTAILASLVIGLFEGAIDRIVALAILMPIVASMGGNAGTQTMTVAVRALAMRELGGRTALRFFGKEIFASAVNGILFALIIGVVAALWFAQPGLGVVIGAAMIVTLVLAGLSGTLIPLGLQRAGIDPAVASTVLLTTVTDVMGFLSFLGLAVVFLL